MNIRKFLLILVILVLNFGFQTVLTAQNVPEVEKQALIALYDSTDGENWSSNTGWLSDDPVADWFGVTVSEGTVTMVDLQNNNLSGSLPDELDNLVNLKALWLNNNLLSGSLPANLGNLSQLTDLWLYSNQLSGSIPSEYGNLANLKYFVISNNQLTDSIPSAIGMLDSLINLNLSNNNLIGSIPNTLGDLSSLVQLFLASNQLSGSMPESLGDLSNLSTLSLDRNQLTGPIPESLGNLTNLVYIALYSNDLEGEIPAVLGNLTNLEFLGLSFNQLSGEIPKPLGDLVNMTNLQFAGNQITGSIPDTLGNLTELIYLDLSSNQLTGNIPAGLGKLEELTLLNLSDNQLSGPIPSEIGGMLGLTNLFLHTNQLDGSVPSSIVNCENLSDLGIEKNNIEDLPDLSALSNLSWLVVSDNKLTFEDIELNLEVANDAFVYSPQDSVGEALDTTLSAGESLVFTVAVGGSANEYQWFKDGAEISEAVQSTFIITDAQSAESGSYNCEITSTLATELTLYSRPAVVTVEGGVGISGRKTGIPKKYALHQNYPNPFNPKTIINYELPITNDVNLEIFNMLGQRVAILVSGRQNAGYHQLEWDATQFASGIYYYKFAAGTYVNFKKMLYIK